MEMEVSSMGNEQLSTFAGHLMAAKAYSLASCVMLFYDIVITIGDEVEKVWRQPFSIATVLWFLNRYLTPLGFIVVTVSFHASWSDSVCDRYVLYPEVLKLFSTAIVGCIFILRLYAIYGRRQAVLVVGITLLLAELGLKIWAFTSGTRLILPKGLVGCILTGPPGSDRIAFTWVAELAFDTVVFIATLSRTLILYRQHRGGGAARLVRVMMRDGLVFFLVIFVANMVTVLLFVMLPGDLKAINASFSALITNLMVSRLILNLRTVALKPRPVVSFSTSGTGVVTSSMPPAKEFMVPTGTGVAAATAAGYEGNVATLLGNLGQPVMWGADSWDADDEDDNSDAASAHATLPVGRAAARRGLSSLSGIVVEVTEEVVTDGESQRTCGSDPFAANARPALELDLRGRRSEGDADASWRPPPAWMFGDTPGAQGAGVRPGSSGSLV